VIRRGLATALLVIAIPTSAALGQESMGPESDMTMESAEEQMDSMMDPMMDDDMMKSDDPMMMPEDPMMPDMSM
jgi:hypothetical protein